MGGPELVGGGQSGGPAPASGEALDVGPGDMVSWSFRVSIPPDADPSRLYYLDAPREGELYRWPEDTSLWGLPKDPPLVRGGARLALRLPLEVGERAVQLEASRVGQHVGVDQALGEYRRPVLVVPAVSVTVDPATVVWPLGSAQPRTLTVRLAGQRPEGASRGVLSLEAPSGWLVEPSGVEFELPGEGTTGSYSFLVRPDPGSAAGQYPIRALARTEDGGSYGNGFRLLDYPHIEPVALFREAEAQVTVVPVRVTEGLRVGYLMGTGDAGPEALRQLGVEIELLGPRALSEGDLSRFDVLVLGARAYEARPDLRAGNERVLDFAREGGTVVVQYNQYQFPAGGFAPYPVEISRPHDRVTDEAAPVRLLDPRAPPLASPNRVTEEDFNGWVMERGLYFLGRWDERFVPILEMADPGEEPLRGSLLVAPLGEGLYVYTGLSFFRQLPAGVPGAYRLFANLISLTAEDWRRYTEERGR